MVRYPARHPGEGKDPANASLDSGLRRKDDREQVMSDSFADAKLFTRQYTGNYLCAMDRATESFGMSDYNGVASRP